jgi:RHS repeat-associated protein
LKAMNGGSVALQYDGDGNRVAETANGVTTRYLVDDLNPTGYAQVMDELVNGTVQREYAYGLQRISQDQLISGTWTPSFYGYDGMGSVRQLTNLNGAVTDTYSYDGFGNLLSSTGATPNNYLYRGEQYDHNLELYYLRARYYNPVTGRFLSRDPEDHSPLRPSQQVYDAEVQPIDVRKLHKYLYTSADPVNRIDPLGREDELEEAEVHLQSIAKRQLKVRTGGDVDAIIDSIQKSFDRVDHVLDDIVRGKIDPFGDE